MTFEEMKEVELELRKSHEKEITKLRVDYAKDNARFEKGQIIDNDIFRILVDDIKYSTCVAYGPPCAVYIGLEMTKQNKPKKSKARESIYQNRKIKVVG